MEFVELVRKNRSYRGYNENRPVTREELTRLVEYARLCPSSVNAQPLKYRLVWQKEEVARLQEKTNWAKALTSITLPHPGMCPTAFIVICQDTGIDTSLQRYQKDVGIVAQTMLLAAVEMGVIRPFTTPSSGVEPVRLPITVSAAASTTAITSTVRTLEEKNRFIAVPPALPVPSVQASARAGTPAGP